MGLWKGYVKAVIELYLKLDGLVAETVQTECDPEVGVGEGWKVLIVLFDAYVWVLWQLLVDLQTVSWRVALDVDLVPYSLFWFILICTCGLVEALDLALW